jgi:beta-mannosidase
VFDGIKMGATISVNGQKLGMAEDEYLRYSFPLSAQLLRLGANSVSVTFDDSINVNGRFMACTGGWDWGELGAIR